MCSYINASRALATTPAGGVAALAPAAIDIRSFQRSSVNLRISSESQSFTNRANCLSPNWSDGDVPRIPLRSASLGRIGGQPDRR